MRAGDLVLRAADEPDRGPRSALDDGVPGAAVDDVVAQVDRLLPVGTDDAVRGHEGGAGRADAGHGVAGEADVDADAGDDAVPDQGRPTLGVFGAHAVDGIAGDREVVDPEYADAHKDCDTPPGAARGRGQVWAWAAGQGRVWARVSGRGAARIEAGHRPGGQSAGGRPRGHLVRVANRVDIEHLVVVDVDGAAGGERLHDDAAG